MNGQALLVVVIGVAALVAWRGIAQGRPLSTLLPIWQPGGSIEPNAGYPSSSWPAQNFAPLQSQAADGWQLPGGATPYRDIIDRASATHQLPPGLLGRVLYEESRFRPDIIDGRTRSSAGALGIAQFMPATARELGIDPLDPAQAIEAAARYLGQLHNRFGDWSQAVAAYNWGQGNVARRGLAAAPAETRAYVRGILGDLGMSA